MRASDPPQGVPSPPEAAIESPSSEIKPSGFSVFFIAASLSFLSGAAGLAHQVLWTRRLVDVLGATSLTFSKVVGGFFLGLALGGWIASRFQFRTNPWVAMAAAETLTALFALPVLFAPQWVEALSPGIVRSESFRFFLPLVLVVPPALCMGLVLPWLVRVLREERAPRQAVMIYGLNTLGGIMGIAVLLLYALPAFGTVRSGFIAVGLNIVIALAALLARNNSTAAGVAFARLPPISLRAASLAFLSGFLVLGSEVILQHQFAQVTINSFFSNGAILALVLLGLGFSALALPIYIAMVPAALHLRLALAAAAVAFLAQPLLLVSFRPGLEILPYELTALPYAAEVLKLGSLAILPLFLAAGLVFPLVLRKFLRSDGTRSAGLLLAFNGAGGWLGAEMTQHWIAPAFGLWQSMVVLGGGYAMAAIALSRARRIPLLALGVAGWAAVALGYRDLPQTSVVAGERVVELQVSPDGVVAVAETAPGDWRILFNNSYTLGGSTAQFNQERQAHLPLLMHGKARTVALLGVATGSTTAGAATHPTLERIDAFELSPLVLRYARTHFAPFNRTVFHDPRAHFYAEDARWGMGTRTNEYDVIIGDLFLPWRTGEGRLFTLEHFRKVRAALGPDGLFCQWLPMFQLTRPQFESIARTFRTAFPDAFLVRGDFYAELPILGLVGGRTVESLDWTAIEASAERLRQVTGQNQVRDALALHAEGVAMLLVGRLPDFSHAKLNTLDKGWLEWDAGQNILGLREPWFVGVPLAEFIRDLQRQSVGQIAERYRAAHEAGQFFLTLEVAAKIESPLAGNLKAQIPFRMPLAIRENASVDWAQWPSRVKPKF